MIILYKRTIRTFQGGVETFDRNNNNFKAIPSS